MPASGIWIVFRVLAFQLGQEKQMKRREIVAQALTQVRLLIRSLVRRGRGIIDIVRQSGETSAVPAIESFDSSILYVQRTQKYPSMVWAPTPASMAARGEHQQLPSRPWCGVNCKVTAVEPRRPHPQLPCLSLRRLMGTFGERKSLNLGLGRAVFIEPAIGHGYC